MAVMTSQHPDGVALEHKIEPVPSSDKMALDLEINGTSNRDETNNDVFDEQNVNAVASLPAKVNEDGLDIGVNGHANLDAFSSNKISISAQPFEIASEPQIQTQTTEPSPSSLLDSSQALDSVATTTDLNSSSLEVQAPELSTLFGSTDSVIEAAVADIAPTTTIPPVVESQESDLRHSNTPLAPAESTIAPDANEHNQLADLNLDSQDSIPSPVEAVPAAVQSEDLPPAVNPESTVVPPAVSPKSEPMADYGFPPADDAEMSEAGAEPTDTDMTDAFQNPPTMSRKRESEDQEEPSAKRTKTEDNQNAADIPEHRATGAQPADPDDAELTAYQKSELIRVLKNTFRSDYAKDVKHPVAVLWPNFAEKYAAMIPQPTDISTMQKKVNEGSIKTMNEMKAEVELILSNSILFNGDPHEVTNRARKTRDKLMEHVCKITPAPVVVPKQAKKARQLTPTGDKAPRAARRVTQTPAPVVAADQTFALNPATSTPLIRRDSTKVDNGRPKREIHPPKNKDLPYSVRPKNQKQKTELRFCQQVLDDLKHQKKQNVNWPFMLPVDPVALNIPTYFQIVKKPMDLSTISTKLAQGAYSKAEDFEKDMRLMLSNCYKFNPVGTAVYDTGKGFEAAFNEEFSKKDSYVSRHSPAATSADVDSDAEDSEEEDDGATTAEQETASKTIQGLKERLLSEQTKLIALMNDKSTDSVMKGMQQDMVDMIQKRLADTQAVADKPAKRAKAPKPKKAAAPAKKAQGVKKAGNKSSHKYMGTLEKETISNGLGMLPDDVTASVVSMIKAERPDVESETDGTMELDIDMISTSLLWTIHAIVMKHVPEVEQQLRDAMQTEYEGPRAAAKAAPKKKNKPMSKHEQERKIEALTQKLDEFKRHGSTSQEPVLPTVESSGDEDSDSEEE